MSSELTAVPEYMIRVKLPDSGSFAACSSGDTEFDEAFKSAIFAAKPPGFEVSWASRSTWPKDHDGYTWVRLYCTNRDDALAHYLKEWQRLSKQLAAFKDVVRSLQ